MTPSVVQTSIPPTKNGRSIGRAMTERSAHRSFQVGRFQMACSLGNEGCALFLDASTLEHYEDSVRRVALIEQDFPRLRVPLRCEVRHHTELRVIVHILLYSHSRPRPRVGTVCGDDQSCAHTIAVFQLELRAFTFPANVCTTRAGFDRHMRRALERTASRKAAT